MGIIGNFDMFKRIVALLLCLALLLSFAACGKDKDNGDQSSKPVSSDNVSSDTTQDYDSDDDRWGNLTDEKKEEIEDLWGTLSSNLSSSGAEIQNPSDDADDNQSSDNSGDTTVDHPATDDGTASEGALPGTEAEIVQGVPTID